MLRLSHSWQRKYVSIGGWCGPALILGKLGLRTEAYPFDFSRCTLDGVIHFINNGFHEGFFPPGPKPYRPECVGIWVLFRGVHTAFAHFDLNDPKIIEGFHKKMERWDRLLDEPSDGVTFFRTISAREPEREIELIPKLEAALRQRNPSLDYRIVLVAHDQGLAPPAVQLESVSDRCSLWALRYTEDDSKTLFDKSLQGYSTIVAHSLDDSNWTPGGPNPNVLEDSEGFDLERGVKLLGQEEAKFTSHPIETLAPAEQFMPWSKLNSTTFPWRAHNNIALIDGIASVGGTCVGVGSTQCTNQRCPFCGSTDYHKAGKPFRTDRPFTDEEDETLLIHLYKILTGGDKVEAVEQLAHEMNRGAYEIICRIQFLTNSSTKITEGLED